MTPHCDPQFRPAASLERAYLRHSRLCGSFRFVLAGALALLLMGLIQGCSKTPNQTAVTPPSPDTSAPPAAVAEPPAASTPFAPRVVNPQTAVADSQAALKSKDYETAAAVLLAAQQQKQLTDQQALAVRNQMVQLQRSLASAIASGDPKAKAAADLLRASSH